VQFWCQFGVGDTRSGADWLNWDGKAEDWVISRGTVVDGVEWRQETADGLDTLLEVVEDSKPEVDLEEMLFPTEYNDQIQGSPISMFKRDKSTLGALTGIAEFFESMSFINSTMDRQFTAYEVAPIERPSQDDVLTVSVLREHPGGRFEPPQGTESRLSPAARVLARMTLDGRLRDGGYKVPALTSDKIISQTRPDIHHQRRYKLTCSCIDR